MVGAVKSKLELIQSEIKAGLSVNLRFYPQPQTSAFYRLSLKDQADAIAYWVKEQDRIDRLMQEAEQGE